MCFSHFCQITAEISYHIVDTRTSPSIVTITGWLSFISETSSELGDGDSISLKRLSQDSCDYLKTPATVVLLLHKTSTRHTGCNKLTAG